MAENKELYSYYAGKKVPLRKRVDQYVVRATPDRLRAASLPSGEPVSPSSVRVTTQGSRVEQEMADARRIGVTHHAYEEADTGREFLITDRVYVKFKPSTDPAQVAELANRYALVLAQRYSDREALFQLTDATGMNPVKLVVKLCEQEPSVETAEHDLNHRVSRAAVALPTDDRYLSQWHLHTRGVSSAFDRRSSSNCEAAWLQLDGFGSPDIVIGVTDDGCKLSHPDFGGPGKFRAWGYFQGNRLVTNAAPDADPALMYEAGSNHGTSCAGVAAADVNALLTVGAAPGCRLVPIKWESDGPYLLLNDSKLRDALDFLADKVDIISNSWGSRPTEQFNSSVTNRIAQLVENGGPRGKGILFLWAAGNENCPVQHTSNLDVPYTSGWDQSSNGAPLWIGVDTARQFSHGLAGKPGVLVVAALASTGQRSHYSNYGTGLSLTAPTNNSHKYRRLLLSGLGVTTSTGEGPSGVTGSFGGTSSATPLVAGIAALVRSTNPNLTAREVASLLKRTASKDLDFEGYPKTPTASYDPTPTWDISPVAPFANGAFQNIGDPDGTWSPWFGHGRVDAGQAVAEALRLRQGSAGRRLELVSGPLEIRIPDNNPLGIANVITGTEAGKVQDLSVAVDITHTWIGDLLVTLKGPDGTTVVLHPRAGGSTKNLRKTYQAPATPELALLRGKSIKGDWTLLVQDLARADEGLLNAWSLSAELVPDTLVLEDVTGSRIPDNDPAGITRQLSSTDARSIQDIAVTLDITHSWIGDLQVELTPPGGPAIILRERSGGNADNIVGTWRASDSLGLAQLRGKSALGAWTLTVRDLAQADEGKLNLWRIEIV